MTRLRPIDVIVSLSFVAILFSPAIVQLAVEARQGEWPQALAIFHCRPAVTEMRAYERNLEQASWIANTLRPWAQFLQFVAFKDAGEKALVGRDGWLFYRPSVRYLTERPPPRSKNTGERPLPAILAFRDQLAARGIRLLVVIAPDKESVYPEKLNADAPRAQPVLCLETRALLGDLRTARVETVDLFETFANAKQSRPASQPPLYLAQDSHWSPAGVELAAHAVAQHLKERGWTAPGAVEHERKASPVKRHGDILRMLHVPMLERRIEPEEIPCGQIVRRDNGEPYRDDPNSDVLVLGDSFLRIYEQDEPGSAGFIAHLARELKFPVTSFVGDGGASTLVRQELYRRPALLKNKKVVIWEFVERDIRFGAEGWQIVPLPVANALHL